MSSQESGEALAWKQKYLKRLDELEQKEERWQATEGLLRQCISRLTLTADGSHASLSQQLVKLRTAIREGVRSDELKPLIDSISQTILRLDDEQGEVDSGGSGIATALQEVIQSTHFPLSVRPFVKSFSHRLEQNEGETAQLRAFMDLLEDIFTQLEGDGESGERQGVMGGLLKGKGRGDDNSHSLALAKRILSRFIAQFLSDRPESETLSIYLNQSQQEAELLVLVDDIHLLLQQSGVLLDQAELEGLPPHEVLIRLMEQLDIPADWNEEFEEIKAQLVKWNRSGAIEPIIGAIAELLRKIQGHAQREKGELEQFLKLMTKRLQAIDIDIKGGYQAHRATFENGVEFNRNVGEQVDGISYSMDEAEDFPALKNSIQDRIDTIRQHMETFQQVETTRIKEAEKQVKLLNRKVSLLQSESSKLHKTLESERKQAYVDPLTGVPNRLAYNERLEQEEHRWQRYGSTLCIAVWDIDKFKSVNDTYGHQAGDKVLTVVAKVLSRKIRDTDFFARFGGEEFVLLMPGTDLENGQHVADVLRQAVEACEFHFHNQRVPVTISCGLAQFREGDDSTTVFGRADKALYQAKEGGRNRVCLDQG
ncbi:MAG: GGDEF domain-containing protein [Gammaproteobacteria bacterium]|nr:GGDEF domain-containing protein [Gammaproteobacteria bacterium]